MNNRSLVRRYNSIAAKWSGPIYAGLRRDEFLSVIIEEAALENLPADAHILDAMCGTGIVGTAVKKVMQESGNDCRLHFLDFSQGMLSQINEPNSEKTLSDVCKIPFADNFFERVFIRFAIYDLDFCRQAEAVKEICRVLKENGLFILATYYSAPETQETLNNIVNLKDTLAGNATFPGRYFPTVEQYLKLLRNGGFEQVGNNFYFSGRICYRQSGEMGAEATRWESYVLGLSTEMRSAIDATLAPEGLTFSFPATIFVAKK